jgi:hypothetical protein
MATKTKGVQVSATITPELDQALEDHRWNVRKTKTELVRLAVEEYAHNHGIIPSEADSPSETPSPDESNAAEGYQEHGEHQHAG